MVFSTDNRPLTHMANFGNFLHEFIHAIGIGDLAAAKAVEKMGLAGSYEEYLAQEATKKKIESIKTQGASLNAIPSGYWEQVLGKNCHWFLSKNKKTAGG